MDALLNGSYGKYKHTGVISIGGYPGVKSASEKGFPLMEMCACEFDRLSSLKFYAKYEMKNNRYIYWQTRLQTERG